MTLIFKNCFFYVYVLTAFAPQSSPFVESTVSSRAILQI